jgi:hypothetical protein
VEEGFGSDMFLETGLSGCGLRSQLRVLTRPQTFPKNARIVYFVELVTTPNIMSTSSHQGA